MSVEPPPPRTAILRPCAAAAIAVLLGVGLASVPAAPASANGACNSTTPALNEQVTCTTAGSATINIPAGATFVRLKVTGGGGGGGVGAFAGGAGGKGSVVSGWAAIPNNGVDKLVVSVGAGGTGGVAAGDSTLGAGGGGGGTGVYLYDSSIFDSTLVVAGGGGGAGGEDVNVPAFTGNGGNARAAGSGYTGDYNAAGGAAAVSYNGGAGGVGQTPGAAGAGAGSGVVSAGGLGALITVRRGGGGGGGYAGGGGGGAESLTMGTSAGETGILTSATYVGGGGGGGSTYVNGTAMPTYFSGHAGSTGAGAGSTGLSVNDPGSVSHGGTGAVEVRFTTAKAAPTVTSVSPTSGPLTGGGTLTITGTDLEGALTVMLPAILCNPVVVVSSTQLTCTIPMSPMPGTFGLSLVSPNGPAILANAYTYAAAPSITSVSPVSGPPAGGGTLTITGTNLLNTSSVQVGGSACTGSAVVSATQVTCTLPANVAGTYDVALTTPSGSDTESGAYTYAEAPDVTSISPTTGLLAGGGTLTVNGTNLTGTTTVTVDGTACAPVVNVSATEVTCMIPARVTAGTVDVVLTATGGSDTLAAAYEYTLPAPTVTSVSPTSGPLAGGGTLTVNGTNLLTATSAGLGDGVCSTVVAVSETQLTCTIPAKLTPGTVGVSVVTPGGSASVGSAYTYLPPPTSAPPVQPPPPVTEPTTPPTTPPTTTPTTQPTPTPEPTPTPTETPTPEPSAPPRLRLTLDLEVNSPVVGAQAVMTGGGLRSRSRYVLTMRSTPVQVATGLTDDSGDFRAQIRLPSRVCVSGGLHELVLTGITPDGAALRDSSWIVLDDNCKTRSVRKAKPANNTVMLGSFIFPHLSARLTPRAKSVLRGMSSPMRTAKRVTITGYTQTAHKSKAARKFNRALATRRAAEVRAYLKSVGVRAPISIVGAGGVKPLKGKAQKYNRRVVITVRY